MYQQLIRRNLQLILLSIVCVPVFVLLTGCASTPARRIDPAGPETISTVQGINIQDWRDAAADMSRSLLSAGVLGQQGEPDLIAISSFVNNTSQHIDKDMLLKKIRTVLSKSGRAHTITTMGVGGKTEDVVATNEMRKKKFLNEDVETPEPDYTMTLKIIEQVTRADRTRQAAYVFQMSLTDVNRGVAVWEDEKTIAKQGSKAAVGW